MSPKKAWFYQAFLHISAMYFKPIFKDVKKAFFLKIGFELYKTYFYDISRVVFQKLLSFLLPRP
jgi:hypothetical protein